MAATPQQLQALEDAILSGALRVEVDGRVVVYQSMENLRAARDEARADLGISPSPRRRGRAWTPTTGSGL